MTQASKWLAAARPRTLPAAVVPVAVGIAVGDVTGIVTWWKGALALVVALCLQIGTNYANDYSDGSRGTDERRVGPVRLVASGLATPQAVRNAAVAVFLIGAIAGLVLALTTSLWVIPVGAGAIAAGYLYTGGPRPYGYAGFGELFVFVFFGLVAVVGTVYVTSGHFPALGFVAAIPVGLCSVALLVVNNLRDITTDAASNKRTLAVHLGPGRTRVLYVGCVVVAVASVLGVSYYRHFALIALVAFIPAASPIRVVLSKAGGKELVAALAMTGALQLILGALLVLGIVL
jgi:1,4-dihydroxy-2-naphthoate octaprenyltransferase